MLAAVLTFAYIGIKQKLTPADVGHASGSKGINSAQSADNGEKKLVAPEGSIILQVGQSRQCRVEFSDGSPADGAFWSSGNEKIVRIKTRCKSARLSRT